MAGNGNNRGVDSRFLLGLLHEAAGGEGHTNASEAILSPGIVELIERGMAEVRVKFHAKIEPTELLRGERHTTHLMKAYMDRRKCEEDLEAILAFADGDENLLIAVQKAAEDRGRFTTLPDLDERTMKLALAAAEHDLTSENLESNRWLFFNNRGEYPVLTNDGKSSTMESIEYGGGFWICIAGQDQSEAKQLVDRLDLSTDPSQWLEFNTGAISALEEVQRNPSCAALASALYSDEKVTDMKFARAVEDGSFKHIQKQINPLRKEGKQIKYAFGEIPIVIGAKRPDSPPDSPGIILPPEKQITNGRSIAYHFRRKTGQRITYIGTKKEIKEEEIYRAGDKPGKPHKLLYRNMVVMYTIDGNGPQQDALTSSQAAATPRSLEGQ